MIRQKIAIHWFRRDLRLDDNSALNAALQGGVSVLPIFIFDTHILAKLKLKDDRRITFIFDCLEKLNQQLSQRNGFLRIYHGQPLEILARLFNEFDVAAVFCNEDYEPYARQRDAEVAAYVTGQGAEFISVKDHVVFSPSEVLKDDGKPYNVFTPYARRWLARFEESFHGYRPELSEGRFLPPSESRQNIQFADLGFSRNDFVQPITVINEGLIQNYHATRDFPAQEGTSRLGVHLRFGTISVRLVAEKAWHWNRKFLSELIWREFYQMILWHYPHTVQKPFRSKYDKLVWPGSEIDFKKWAAAETGYPLVDAGIRELTETGFMHNRVRMVAASFLTKHLLCDWRWGEHFFAQHLLDFEQASNVGGWQWSAGIGADAAPYFRIFNPAEQQKKFDPDGSYVNRWLKGRSDFFGTARIEPMIDHRFARERCLKFFSAVRH